MRYIFLGISSVFSSNIFAIVLTISGGPAFENAGETQTISLLPNIEKTYQANNNTHVIANGEIFVGVERLLFQKLQGQIGIAAGYSSHAQLSGNIWENADPNFNNYGYSASVYQTRLTIKGFLFSRLNAFVQPYISAGVGGGFNHSYNYISIPKIFEEVSTAGFSSNTTSSLTYNVGLGFQKSIQQHIRVGIGYEFSDWGRSGFSRAPNQTLGNGIQLNHLYTHELRFSLSYVS